MKSVKKCTLYLTTFLVIAPVWAQDENTDSPDKEIQKKIVHLELHGPVLEAPASDPFGFGTSKIWTTKKLIDRLKEIRTDESVSALYITFENTGMGLAQVQEIRNELQKLKLVDKEVYVHLDTCYSSGLYWLASTASQLAVVPTSDVWLTGLYGEQLYLKTMLEKLHLSADVVKMGDYKSAGEMLTRTEPSEPAAEMLNWMYDDIYRQMVEQIAESRSMTPKQIESLIDKGPYSSERALQAGLVDRVAYRKDFVDEIKERHGDIPIVKGYGSKDKMELDFSNPFAFFEVFQQMLQPETEPDRPGIALIYVEGTIITGEGESDPFGGASNGASSRLRKAIYDAANNENINAVVLRVDSPGGSAIASEIIWNATQAIRAQNKPLIVSMGNVAASGGYYVSCGADTIFAEPGTLTGSIGVIGMKLITKDFWEWMGIQWHPIQRGKNADILATNKAWEGEQRELIQGYMEDVYEVFKSRIEEQRSSKLAKPLDDIAGGRVYTGAQALELGLVDKLGGLSDALTFAALQANMGDDYDVRILPRPKTFFDMLAEDFAVHSGLSSNTSISGRVEALHHPMMLLNRVEPAKARALMQMLQLVEVGREEHVLMAMPTAIVFH